MASAVTRLSPRIAALYDTLATSDHVQYIQQCNALFSKSWHALSVSEIEQLQRNGNTAEDWSRVFKTRSDTELHTSRIRDCDLQGFVVLGAFDDGHVALDNGSSAVTFLSGCYRSTLRNCVVMDNALVRDTLALSDTLVDAHACVVRCGSVSMGTHDHHATTSFASGALLHVGVEVGGRDLRMVAEMSFATAADIATSRQNTDLLAEYDAFARAYAGATQSHCSIVAPHARVVHCSLIQSSFIGPFATVYDSELVHSSVLSSSDEPTAITGKSIVRDSIVQWNCRVRDAAFVEHALLCDTSQVERHGIVLSSVLGANTSVAEGEVTSSLVGPFVGFHHQALLIASVWPEGKGNVGYGANVGSNHTLKAPDQELFPGEGVFFGLGCCVKFPSNFTRAPYSVIATGVNTLPQSIEMPFALINAPGHNIQALSPAINEISPAWVLTHSVFTVLRNESKFATRNKSKRTRVTHAVLLRPDIVQYMQEARRRLVAAKGKATLLLNGDSGEAIFTDAQVRGLGKNYMRESSRAEAVETYTFFIQVFALDGLLQWMEEQAQQQNQVLPATIQELPAAPTALQLSFQLRTLVDEFPGSWRLTDALQELVARRLRIVESAIRGKKRDDARGARILDDYALVHAPVESEAAVKYAQRIVNDTKQRVSRFLAKM